MKVRIIKKRYYYYPQIRKHFFKWANVGVWWGNYGDKIIDGKVCQIYRDFRICIDKSSKCKTIGEADFILKCLKKQGYIYKKSSVSPIFKDGYIFYNKHLN